MGNKPNKIELPPSEYWQDRFAQLEDAQHNKAVDYDKNLLKQYRRTQKEVEGKIRVWYQRFADNNEVTLADAKKMLKKSELAELKWNVNEYIKYGKENGIDQKWMKELENASAKFHISRLEAIQLNVRNSIEQLYDGQLKGTKKVLGEIYKDGVYHSAYEIQKGLGVGFDTARIDQNEIEKVLAKPWAVDERNFSERIWGSKKKLINEVENELTSMVATGKSPDKSIKVIMNKFGVSRYNASRLIMTESAYFNSLATKDELNELGVDQFEILATLDSRTSPICRAMDGKHFNVKDYQVGVTAPPFHPHCRTTTVPYFDDEFTVDEVRAARNEEDGSTYYVPSDIKYNDWEEAFVNGDHKGFTPITGENGKITFKRDEPTPVKVKQKFIEKVDNKINQLYDAGKVEYNPPKVLDEPRTEQEIIDLIGGGDRTGGSCASLGLCYAGQVHGIDVVDFRGGKSMDITAMKFNLDKIMEAIGDENMLKATARSTLAAANKLLKQVEEGKQYYYAAGKHCAIVRKENGKLQYLELQTTDENGWTDFDGNPRYTLSRRFGCTSRNKFGLDEDARMIEVSHMNDNDFLKNMLGFINTDVDKQKKGVGGYAK